MLRNIILAAASFALLTAGTAHAAFDPTGQVRERSATETGFPREIQVKVNPGDTLSGNNVCTPFVPTIAKVYGFTSNDARLSCWEGVMAANPGTITNYHSLPAGKTIWIPDPALANNLATVEDQMTTRKSYWDLASKPITLAGHVVALEGRLSGLDTRVNAVEALSEATEQRRAELEKKLGSGGAWDIPALQQEVSDVDSKVSGLETKVNNLAPTWWQNHLPKVIVALALLLLLALGLSTYAARRSRMSPTNEDLEVVKETARSATETATRAEAIARTAEHTANTVADTAAKAAAEATAKFAISETDLRKATEGLATKDEVAKAQRTAEAADEKGSAAHDAAKHALSLHFGKWMSVGDLPSDEMFADPSVGVVTLRFKHTETDETRTVRLSRKPDGFAIEGLRGQRNHVAARKSNVLRTLKGAFDSNRVEGIELAA